jgi:hypothetical protein
VGESSASISPRRLPLRRIGEPLLYFYIETMTEKIIDVLGKIGSSKKC